jgi:hypothetical protein
LYLFSCPSHRTKFPYYIYFYFILFLNLIITSKFSFGLRHFFLNFLFSTDMNFFPWCYILKSFFLIAVYYSFWPFLFLSPSEHYFILPISLNS